MFRRGSKKNVPEKQESEKVIDSDYETIAQLLQLQKPQNGTPPSMKHSPLTRKSSLPSTKLGSALSEVETAGKGKKKPSFRRRSTGITKDKLSVSVRAESPKPSRQPPESNINSKPSNLNSTDYVSSPLSAKLSSRRKTLGATTEKDISKSDIKFTSMGGKATPPISRRHSEVRLGLWSVFFLFTCRLLSANNFNQLYSVQADLCRQKKDLHIAKMRHCVVQNQVRSPLLSLCSTKLERSFISYFSNRRLVILASHIWKVFTVL